MGCRRRNVEIPRHRRRRRTNDDDDDEKYLRHMRQRELHDRNGNDGDENVRHLLQRELSLLREWLVLSDAMDGPICTHCTLSMLLTPTCRRKHRHTDKAQFCYDNGMIHCDNDFHCATIFSTRESQTCSYNLFRTGL